MVNEITKNKEESFLMKLTNDLVRRRSGQDIPCVLEEKREDQYPITSHSYGLRLAFDDFD